MRLVMASLFAVVCLLQTGGGESRAGEPRHATDRAIQSSAGTVMLAQRGPRGSGTGENLPPPLSPLPAVAPSAEGLVDPREGGLQVGLGEWAVALEADTIRPGSVTFVIRNKGTRTHGFRIRSLSGRGRDRFELRTPLIPPGGERSVTLILAPGRYRVDCYVTDAAGDHGDLGMRTMLTVSADAPLHQQKPPDMSPAVSIGEFAFSPELLKVPAGTAVTWTNNDPTPHTITADDGSFDSGEISPGGTFRRTFDRPGTYSYHCVIHPAMQGKVTAEP
jgi:plastocyanin